MARKLSIVKCVEVLSGQIIQLQLVVSPARCSNIDEVLETCVKMKQCNSFHARGVGSCSALGVLQLIR